MNTGENYREFSDDELNQVTGGGPVAHEAYLGVESGTRSLGHCPTMPRIG